MKLYMENMGLGEASNINFYTALEAYYNMGFEVVKLDRIEIVNTTIEEDNIFLGSINFMHDALRVLNVSVPEPLDYPASLVPFLGRKVWESTINEIADDPGSWNVFVKPKGYAKKFTGRVVKNTYDLISCGDRAMNTPVWVSEPVDFVSEWRVFVRYGRVLGARMYKGDWRGQYDHKVIEKAVSAYENPPAGYALDFGLTPAGRMLLVEANDGFSLGSYGLFYTDYAKLLSARWAQLTAQKDLCNF